MTGNNLVPTVRTDKNGRAVIRHMKPGEVISLSAAAIPAPAVTRESDTQRLIKEVVDVIEGKVTGETGLVFDVNKEQLLALEGITPEHVARLHDLVTYFDKADDNKFFKELIDYVTPTDEEATEILSCYRDYLWKHPEDTEAVVIMHRALQKQGVPTGTNGSYASMNEHLQAQSHYTQQYRAQHGYKMMLHYLENRVYIHTVERHADKLPQLLAYRDIRGIPLVDRTDNFDEDDFQSYLSYGAVGDGFL